MNDLSKAIKTAIAMEEDGIDFYQKAAKGSSHPFGGRMFVSFAEDEKRHLAVLRDILTDLKFLGSEQFFKGKTPRERIKTVFQDVKDEMRERIAANPDELGAVKIGMDMEARSVEFYRDALDQTQDSNIKRFFKRVIDEEREHYQILQNTYSYLEDSGNWFLWEERGLLDGG